jgi:hypothetical protein
MHALSLSQPWAWCVVHGPKRVENRSAPSIASVARTLIGQRIAIHAAKSWDNTAAPRMRDAGLVVPMQVALPAGALIGVATIGDVCGIAGITDPEQKIWAFGPFCIVLTDVRAIEHKVPCRGLPYFWPLPYDLEQRVLAQLEEVSRG